MLLQLRLCLVYKAEFLAKTKMRLKNKDSSNSWLVKSIIFLILIAVSFFGYALFKEMSKKKQVESEINSLKQEAEKIKKENMQLEERIAYLGSQDYQETEARDKLNLQKPDEKVVVLAQGPERKEIVSQEIQMPAAAAKDQTPNYQKWWDYFFK